MKPKYVKCINVWSGTNGASVRDKIYDTDVPNTFSYYTWEDIYKGAASTPKHYFVEVSEDEWNKQQNIITNTYLIY